MTNAVTPPPKKPILPPDDLHRESRRRVMLMAVVALAILGLLLFLKQGADREQAAAAQALAATKQQQAANNAALTQTLAKHPGGESSNAEQLALVKRVGVAFATKTDAKKLAVTLRFHLLTEANGINLFALPDGNIYLTTALINRMRTEGELAAAIAHGVAHVMAGDGVTPPATAQSNPLVLPAWTYDVVQERAADALAVKLMGQAGYDPNAIVGMFAVLADAYRAGADVSFFISHPNEEHRMDALAAAIASAYPDGIPAILSK